MEKILGLDLGTNSIGWAIVEKDENITKLYDEGVCIFQEGVAREKDVEKPAVQERTKARASRRHYFRRRLRKISMLRVLIANGFCPYLPEEALLLWKEKKCYPMDDMFLSWQRTDDNLNDNPYFDRYRALTEKLDFTKQDDRYCFGRAMYHLVQRRGFLSNRKDNSLDSETGKVKSGISSLSKEMASAGCKYLGEYFYKLYQSKSKIRTHYTARIEHYKTEFEEICRIQGVSDELKSQLEKAIFFQRPLKSQKGLVGKCTFETNKPRCPLSHPRFEEFRMWSFINSIKMRGPRDESFRILNTEEVSQILPLFFRGRKVQFEFEDIEKKIAGKGNYGFIDDKREVPYRFNYREKVSVSACPVITGLLALLGGSKDYNRWDKSLASLYLRANNKNLEQIINDIWHALYSFTDDKMLSDWIVTNLQATREDADTLVMKTKIPAGYASLSLKAIRKILPFLKRGYRYDWAVMLAGVSNAFSIEKRHDSELMRNAHERIVEVMDGIAAGTYCIDAKKGKYILLQNVLKKDFGAEHAERMYHPSMIEAYPKVQPDGHGKYRLGSPRISSIKNPMAMRSLFRLRALINELLDKDEIDQNTKINIEFARGLNNANMRKAIESYQRNLERLHKKYYDEIKVYFDSIGQDVEPTEDDILKYQLWEEQHHKCLYTGNEISIREFIGSDTKYDIEHTVPRSRGGDNSAMNKTLCLNSFNRDIKRNKLPSELSEHSAVLAIIEALGWNKTISDFQFLIECRRKDSKSAETKAAKDSAIQRMNELKLQLDYWRGKVERFSMTEVPSGFSNRQGVDIGIIGRYARMYLQTIFPKLYVVKGLTTADFRKAWGLQDEYEKKSRDSHVHHCIDAITIACIGKKEYDYWKQYAEQVEYYTYGEGSRPNFPKPWPTFTEDVKDVSNKLLVSHNAPNNMGKRSKKRMRIRGKLQYGTDGQKLFITGDTARGSLNKDTFYGAIERNGEIKYVIRKSLDLSSLNPLKETDVEKIVDDSVRTRIKSVISEKGFKRAMTETIWMNEKKGIPIKKVRVFSPSVTSPIKLKKHRDLSSKVYKRDYCVVTDGNYCMAVYGNGSNRPSFKLYSNLTAARIFNTKGSHQVPLSDENDMPLSFILKQGMMVLFYDKSPEEIYQCTNVELSQRLYKVTELCSDGRIVFRFHSEARPKKDLQLTGGWKNSGEYFPLIRVSQSKLMCLVEGLDFHLSVDGKIEFIHRPVVL